MRFLLLNQTFHPDVMATGQYLTEVALQLVEREHEVTVMTSRRAYDHPEREFARQETWRGVRIIRVGSTGFGKGAKWRRGADFASFLALCALRLAVLRRHHVVVALTSPPLISLLGACVARLWRSRFVYWVMDFNPDEAIAAGWLRAGSLAAKTLDRLSRFSLKRADRIIALDRFMRERILAKGILPEKILVLPPWCQDHQVAYDPVGRDRFRRAHGLDGKFVVMYSGNHSPCHPLDTLLEAARQLASERDILFCFVGGGSEWRRIRAAAIAGSKLQMGSSALESGAAFPGSNVRCLPYQPMTELAGSLSAADLHVVVMGQPFTGLVHPSKIYNILGVGAPVLYIGPHPSPVTEVLGSLTPTATSAASPLLPSHPYAIAAHGEPQKVAAIIRQLRAKIRSLDRLAVTQSRAPFSRAALLPRLVAALECGQH